MKPIRIGVIGVGVMGERHCRVYSNLRGVQFVGVADQNAERGRAVATTYDTEYFDDYQKLLAEVDAVSIVTSTPSHFNLAKEALSRGVHVLVKKPIAETLAQAEQLVAAAEQSNRILMVGHIERFNPTFMEIKNITEGRRIIAINIRRLSPFDTSNTDVDVIRDLMIHDLDLVANLVGNNLEGFSAWGRSVVTGAIDHAVATLSFREGPIVTLFASRITEQKVRLMEVITQGAYIEADLLGKSVVIYRRTWPEYLDTSQVVNKYRQESVIERIYVPVAEPLMLELRHFVECVHENKPASISGQDGLYALQLAQRITDYINSTMALSSVTPGETA